MTDTGGPAAATPTPAACSSGLGWSDEGEGSTAMPIARSAAVQMWYDERGHGDPSVLLHPGGAGVDSRALTPTLEAPSELFHVYAPENRGHGPTPDLKGPTPTELMAPAPATSLEPAIGHPEDRS